MDSFGDLLPPGVVWQRERGITEVRTTLVVTGGPGDSWDRKVFTATRPMLGKDIRKVHMYSGDAGMDCLMASTAVGRWRDPEDAEDYQAESETDEGSAPVTPLVTAYPRAPLEDVCKVWLLDMPITRELRRTMGTFPRDDGEQPRVITLEMKEQMDINLWCLDGAAGVSCMGVETHYKRKLAHPERPLIPTARPCQAIEGVQGRGTKSVKPGDPGSALIPVVAAYWTTTAPTKDGVTQGHPTWLMYVTVPGSLAPLLGPADQGRIGIIPNYPDSVVEYKQTDDPDVRIIVDSVVVQSGMLYMVESGANEPAMRILRQMRMPDSDQLRAVIRRASLIPTAASKDWERVQNGLTEAIRQSTTPDLDWLDLVRKAEQLYALQQMQELEREFRRQTILQYMSPSAILAAWIEGEQLGGIQAHRLRKEGMEQCRRLTSAAVACQTYITSLMPKLRQYWMDAVMPIPCQYPILTRFMDLEAEGLCQHKSKYDQPCARCLLDVELPQRWFREKGLWFRSTPRQSRGFLYTWA